MHVFGLTGGLASGKSTVARRIVELGVPVLDADQLARDVVAPGTPGLAAIQAWLGPEALTGAGALNRAWVANLVFHDPKALLSLNAIVHPLVAARFAELCATLASEGQPLLCYEVPLLFENGLEHKLRPVVLVAATEKAQLERALARGLSREQALARIHAQAPLAEKLARADYVIETNGSIEQTRNDTEHVLERVRSYVRDRAAK